MAAFLKQERNGIALLPRLIFIALLCRLFYRVDERIFFVYAFFIYLLVAYSLKFLLIPGSTFTGVRLMREDRYEEAIPYIDEDVAYFTKRSWIDRYRFLLMISSSPRTYRELCLCNKAWCLLQTGKVKESKALYESVLSEYPGNIVAQTQLNTINMVQQNS